MPYVTISTTPGFSADQKKQLLQEASDAVVHSISAPVASVRVLLHELGSGHYISAGQFDTPTVMFQVEFIEGRTTEQKAALIAALSKVGQQSTGVPESEIRVRIIDFPKENMGLAGGVSALAMGR